ncbi:MAG: PD-(D/E)XK nuclease family protein [Planctomycetes bacterium]|jgi:hypothetical protein|nr:PD-(D/E)XK nuclease family protein [Planctomycetota bacterium]
MPKPKLHVSHISMGARCGEQLRRFLAGERIPPGIAAIVGTANHKADEQDMTAKLKGEPLTELGASNELVATVTNSLWGEGVFLSEDERQTPEPKLRGLAVERAVRLNTVRRNVLVPQINPKAVARKCVLEVEGFEYDLAGEIDLEEQDDSINDLKTKAKAPPKDEADKSIQLTMYTLFKFYIDKVMPPKVKLNVLVDSQLKTPGKVNTHALTLSSTRSPEELEAMLLRVANFMECLKKGVFMPTNPDNWWCSRRFCGYAPTCPYVRGIKTFGWAGDQKAVD